MAKLYGEIAKSALLTLDKSFSRALGQPLDASEVYYSLEAAQTYAATPAAYIGQKIVVIEDGKVTHYSVEDAAGTLKEVGVNPLGDGKSITVSEAGIVSILGVDGADSLTLPRMKEDKSGIEWVPVSAVVKGDGNDNTTYEITALTKEAPQEGETHKEGEICGIKVKTLFNGTAVEGGEFTIDLDVYTKTETDAAIDAAVKGILGDNVKEAYDTLKEIQDILEGTDGQKIDGLIETVADNKAKIEVLNGDASTAGSVDKKIADAIADQDFSAYAKTEDVERDYAKKATTLAGYGITDAYTKTEIDTKIGTPGVPAVGTEGDDGYIAPVDGTGIFANAYSKAEVNDLLDKVSGGSSETAASVKRQLDEYKTSNNQRVSDLETKVGKDVNGEEPATGLFLEVDQARAQADKGVEDAAAAAQAVTQLTNGQVATNKTNIENLQTLVGTIGDGRTDTLAGKIGALEAHDVSHAVEFNTLSGKVDQNTSDIALKADADKVYTKGATDALLLAKANADDVYSKSEVYNITEADAAVKKVTGEVASDTTLVAMIGKKADQDTTYTKTEVDNIINDLAIADVNKSIEDNANAIATLIGSVEGDDAKSVRDITAEETAKIVAGADEKYDTLKEIADWIKSDTTGAAKMASDINTNKTAIEKLNGNKDTVGSVLYMIDQHKNVQATDTILGLVKSSAAQNKIAVTSDGTMEVNSLNVNKLVQTDGEELVLNGGKA